MGVKHNKVSESSELLELRQLQLQEIEQLREIQVSQALIMKRRSKLMLEWIESVVKETDDVVLPEDLRVYDNLHDRIMLAIDDAATENSSIGAGAAEAKLEDQHLRL